MGTSKQNQTRVTRIGNPTTYNGSDARITQSADKLVLDPKTGVIHYMYPDNRITRYTTDWKDDPVETEVPEEYYDYWRNAFEQARANAQPNLLQRGVHLVGRGIEKAGNWLQRFENGGTTQSAVSTEQDVMNTIDAAIGEIQTKRPGQAVQKLAAMMQDPNYSMIIDMIKQEYPQIEGILNTVEQMVGAYKCGGKTKKKVKKGAKGCVPCKKLMRVGGKLINVLTDCEGNIISKHLIGGWIRKGNTGFNTAVLNEAYTKAATAAPLSGKTGEVHYYQDTDGSWKKQTWTHDGGRSPFSGSWSDGQDLTDADQAAFVLWRDNNAGNIFKTGFTANWDNYSGTFDTEDNAIAAIGREAFDLGAFTGKTVRSVTGKSGNTWLGADTSSPTSQDYIDQYGFQGALNKEGILRRARLLEAKQDRRAATRAALKNGLVGQGQLRAINQEWRDSRDEIKSQHKAQTAALINAYTSRSHSTVGTPNLTTGSMTHTPTSTTQAIPAKKEEYTIMSKQGGWLNKFLDGGATEPKLSEYKFHRGEIKTPAGYGVIQEGFYPTYSFGNKTGITYDFDDSPRWGRNIYITPHGNDTVYYHTSDPYEYLDMYPTTYILVGTPYKSQQVAKKGWHNMLHGVNIPVRPLDGDEAAFNRAKKEK